MEELIVQHEKMIVSIISKLNYVSSDISHDELMQIGRLAIWRSADKHSPNRGKMSTFLYTCIQRDIWKHLDREGKHKHISTGDILEDETSEDIQSEIEMSILKERLRELFGENADYFIERFMYGNTIDGIAESYDTTVKKVAYWSNKIHKYIKEDYHEEKN